MSADEFFRGEEKRKAEALRAQRHHEFFLAAFRVINDRDAVEEARAVANRAYPPPPEEA